MKGKSEKDTLGAVARLLKTDCFTMTVWAFWGPCKCLWALFVCFSAVWFCCVYDRKQKSPKNRKELLVSKRTGKPETCVGSAPSMPPPSPPPPPNIGQRRIQLGKAAGDRKTMKLLHYRWQGKTFSQSANKECDPDCTPSHRDIFKTSVSKMV